MIHSKTVRHCKKIHSKPGRLNIRTSTVKQEDKISNQSVGLFNGQKDGQKGKHLTEQNTKNVMRQCFTELRPSVRTCRVLSFQFISLIQAGLTISSKQCPRCKLNILKQTSQHSNNTKCITDPFAWDATVCLGLYVAF